MNKFKLAPIDVKAISAKLMIEKDDACKTSSKESISEDTGKLDKINKLSLLKPTSESVEEETERNTTQRLEALDISYKGSFYPLPSGKKVLCKAVVFTDPLVETTVFEGNKRPEDDIDDSKELDDSIVLGGGNSVPVIVRMQGDSYEVIAGARRRMSTIRVNKPLFGILLLGDVSDHDALKLTTIENIARKSTDPFMAISEYCALLYGDSPAVSRIEDLAMMVGKSRENVQRNMNVRHIPYEIYENFSQRKNITMKQAQVCGSNYKKLSNEVKAELVTFYSIKKSISFSEFFNHVATLNISQNNVDENETGKELKKGRVGTSDIIKECGQTVITKNKTNCGVLFRLPPNVNVSLIDLEKINEKLKALLDDLPLK